MHFRDTRKPAAGSESAPRRSARDFGRARRRLRALGRARRGSTFFRNKVARVIASGSARCYTRGVRAVPAPSREITRLEGFSDAVFGFALPLLVVSLEVPQTQRELMEAMRGFGAFAVCFGIVSWIWYEHNLFFRRYGLQDGLTILLNHVLLFVVLFYVYPLKFVFTSLLGDLFGGSQLQQAPMALRCYFIASRSLPSFSSLPCSTGMPCVTGRTRAGRAGCLRRHHWNVASSAHRPGRTNLNRRRPADSRPPGAGLVAPLSVRCRGLRLCAQDATERFSSSTWAITSGYWPFLPSAESTKRLPSLSLNIAYLPQGCFCGGPSNSTPRPFNSS